MALKKEASYLKMELNLCIFCRSTLYKLANGMLKCSGCKKKYSLKKLQRDFAVLELFVAQKSAKEAAKTIPLSYQSVFTRYEKFRALIVHYLQENYHDFETQAEEFEEYLFVYNSQKKLDKKFLLGYNFITFSKKKQVYNVLLPSLKRFSEEQDALGLKSFVRKSHISKVQTYTNTITVFWEFFESFMKTFKGVHKDSFLLYLKEAEFRFNYTPSEQKKILEALWIDSIV